MSLSNFNASQQAEILVVLYKYTASSVAPLLLLESFILGVLFACVPLGSYLLWVKPRLFSRAPLISILWIIFTALITHWALSLRQLESNLSGRSMGTSLSQEAVFHSVGAQANSFAISNSYAFYDDAWELFLPLVTETVLFGFASFLFAVTVYTYLWPTLSQWRSCFPLIIPAMASLMYILSLTHWAVSLRSFTLTADLAAALATQSPVPFSSSIELNLALLTLLSINAVMSDSIVLWRMCVVWDRARPILAFGAALLVATLGLNIANIVGNADDLFTASGGFVWNEKNTEIVPVYGRYTVGLAAVFVSLASNLCATTLVGIKAWMHRRQFSQHLRSNSHRTLVERFMELLVDSGVAYTVIWLLYCISFYRNILIQDVFDQGADGPAVTAVDHLDAAMAQITSIYPLFVFIIVALDKVHHSRGPRALRNNEWPRTRSPAVAVTFDVDIERSTPLSPTSAHPMMAVAGNKHLATVEDDKNRGVSADN